MASTFLPNLILKKSVYGKSFISQSFLAIRKAAIIRQKPEPYGSRNDELRPVCDISSVALIRVPAPNQVANKQNVDSHKEKLLPPTKKSSLLSVFELATYPTPKSAAKKRDNVIEKL